MGQLYNKEALLEYMIRRAKKAASASEHEVARHVKSVKADVRQVTLHANRVQEAEQDDFIELGEDVSDVSDDEASDASDHTDPAAGDAADVAEVDAALGMW